MCDNSFVNTVRSEPALGECILLRWSCTNPLLTCVLGSWSGSALQSLAQISSGDWELRPSSDVHLCHHICLSIWSKQLLVSSGMEVADWSSGTVSSLVKSASAHQIHTMAEGGTTLHHAVQRLPQLREVDLLANIDSSDLCNTSLHAPCWFHPNWGLWVMQFSCMYISSSYKQSWYKVWTVLYFQCFQKYFGITKYCLYS